MIKQCSKCKIGKFLTDFYKDNRTRDGLYSSCKMCQRLYHEQWMAKGGKDKMIAWRKNNKHYNSNYYANYQANYYANHKEYYTNYYVKWYAKNKEKKREYERIKRKTSIKFRLDENISRKIRYSLHGAKGRRKWEDLVGYSVEDLIKHLEYKFESWMSWENYGKWHIDHIIPKSHFKYETAEDSQFKNCWALENLQPLEAIKNFSKGNRIIS